MYISIFTDKEKWEAALTWPDTGCVTGGGCIEGHDLNSSLHGLRFRMCVAPSTFHLKHWRRNRKFFRMSYQMIASNADLALAYRSEWKKTVWTSLFWSTNQTSQAFSGTSFWFLPFVLHLNSNEGNAPRNSNIINSDQGVFNTGIRGMCVFTAGVVYSAALWSLSETRSIVIFSRRGFVLQTVYSSFFFFLLFFKLLMNHSTENLSSGLCSPWQTLRSTQSPGTSLYG